MDLIGPVEQFRQREHADHDGHEVDAADELGRAEGEAHFAAQGVHADGGEEQPGDAHEQAFDLVVFGQAGDAGEAEADEAADFQRAAVLHGQIRKLGGGDDQRNTGEQAAEDGGHGDPAEGLFRFARLGHGVTFESGTG